MLVLLCECADLIDLGGGHILRVNAADAASRAMHLQHNHGRLLTAQAKKLLQYDYYEIHRRVIVVEQYDTEQ